MVSIMHSGIYVLILGQDKNYLRQDLVDQLFKPGSLKKTGTQGRENRRTWVIHRGTFLKSNKRVKN